VRLVASSSNQTMELRVGNKYRLGRKIGSGSFGDIFLGKFSNTIFPPSPDIFRSAGGDPCLHKELATVDAKNEISCRGWLRRLS
jgi:hypothetical protein